jgi:hypothetical protein
MWISQFEADGLFHRFKDAYGDREGKVQGVAYCGAKGTEKTTGDVITCLKCKELHEKMTLERLRST